MPLLVLAVLVVAASALLAVVLVRLMRHPVASAMASPGTVDVEGAYITVVGGLYAILLAFMVVVVWTDFQAAGDAVDQEANRVADLYRLAGALPPDLRRSIRQACRDYVEAVEQDEWPAMARRQPSPRAWAATDQLWVRVRAATPARVEDAVLRESLLETLLALAEQRRLRLFQAEATLPALLWGVLLFGALLTVALAAAFRVEPSATHALKAAVLAAMISVLLLTIGVLDRPFGGAVHITPEAFAQARAVFRRID
ncbi:MAG: DUF4239 domain-containing protein [Armatimonadetes bacterium]|nr:DUF4239 domain-containing protein [Armatimonadota bacterium]